MLDIIKGKLDRIPLRKDSSVFDRNIRIWKLVDIHVRTFISRWFDRVTFNVKGSH